MGWAAADLGPSQLGPGRLVQDRTYFQTELRRRINLISKEIAKLQSETDQIDRENINAGALEKRLGFS